MDRFALVRALSPWPGPPPITQWPPCHLALAFRIAAAIILAIALYLQFTQKRPSL